MCTVLYPHSSHHISEESAYGGTFIVSSLIWGFYVDKKRPDKYEIIGALIALVGVFVMFYIPR